jgi:hypothetical protein
MRKEKMSKMKMPAAPAEDEMLQLDELDLEMEPEDEGDMEDEESAIDLTSASDDDLMAELEARGFVVEAPEEEASEEEFEDMEDEELS